MKIGEILKHHTHRCLRNKLRVGEKTEEPGQEPYNQVDTIAMKHDICYRDNSFDKISCDKEMLDDLSEIKPKDTREKFDKALVGTIINTKQKLEE